MRPFRRAAPGHADPIKLKVLVEDFPSSSWLDRLSAPQFGALVVFGSIAMASAVYAAALPQTRGYMDEAFQAASKRTMAWVDDYRNPDVVQVMRSDRTNQKSRLAARSTGCDPNYGGCVPISSDVDCRGGMGNGPAYTGRVQVIGYDVYDLDADGDGVGCE